MQTQFKTLPIAGSIKHGTKKGKEGKERPVELGYFVAQVHNDAMQHFVEKFNNLYKESKELNIYFPDENPFTERRVRNNQGGTVCYCLLNQTKGKEKIGKQWSEKECSEECEYRTAPKGKKPACLIEGILKFMIPEISSDRIWCLKTKSYYSRQNIKNYINFQKQLNNSLIGNYKLFLIPKEDTIEGKTFNNFVLDIVKNENFISSVSNQEITSNKSSSISNQKTIPNKATTIQKGKKDSNNTTSKEISKSSIESVPIPKSSTEQPTEKDLKRYYVLIDSEEVLINKEGVPTKYLQATFCDKDSKEIKAIITPKYAKEMSMCELGSQFLLDVEDYGKRKIVNNCEYLVKQLKEAV